MNNVLNFSLISETKTKDVVGQTVARQDFREVIGIQDSIYQSEFFQAEQAGIRAQFRLIIAAIDYNNEDKVLVDGKEYSIYRTFLRGRDRIELYVGERVGNGKD